MLLAVNSFPAHSYYPTRDAANTTTSEFYSWVFLAPVVFCSPMESWNLRKKSIPTIWCGFRNIRLPIFKEALQLSGVFLVALSYISCHHHNPGRVSAQCDWLSDNTTVFPTGSTAGLEHLWDSKSSAGRGSELEFCKGQQLHLYWEET